jgi:hypothetical protein
VAHLTGCVFLAISAILKKKMLKSFGGSRKICTFATAFREMLLIEREKRQ